MYALYRHFHAFCNRVAQPQRMADWFCLHRVGLRCLKAWWRAVLVQKQTQLLRATQIKMAKRPQRTTTTSSSYTARQREIQAMSAKLKSQTPDLASLACDDSHHWADDFIGTPEAASPVNLVLVEAPPPVSPCVPPPVVTWNECMLDVFHHYLTFPPIDGLPVAGQRAVRLFDCVRMLGWMYNDFSFHESKRILVRALLHPPNSSPSHNVTLDLATFCRYLDLVAQHRSALQVDTFTKTQSSRFHDLDCTYAAMPALATCRHLKRLLMIKIPVALLSNFTTPPTMLGVHVLRLIEQHRKLLRSFFMAPCLKRIGTTGGGTMLRHAVVTKDEFVSIAKSCHIFPMVTL
ncbi:hypothetical protein DYB31_005619 [Aphanomyces astaci]|uniref:Uncharacterized protein n=1 Tax=Aphanomyces astaci TaxID=112090 RepID=A0A397FFV4_APHAT|nr:hypothetical protein DYB31_005619 [Aphanomyces astaci]